MSLLTRGGDGTESLLGRSPADWGATTVQASLLNRSLIGKCANSDCRTSWLHLFRKRSTPVFEGGWTCSPECTEARILKALCRELDGRGQTQEVHRHRIPLGLLMLEHGWITHQQLRRALEAQRASGSSRIGECLIRQGATDEATVTRALGLQWSCPVLSTESHGAAALASVMPRLFVDAFGALPLRVVGGRLLYIGFEQSLDPVLAFSISRMTGLQVESGIVPSSLFVAAHGRMLKEQFPSVQLSEAVSESAAAALLRKSVERFQPVGARLVRVHDCVWLRMWRGRRAEPISHLRSVSDVLCSIGRF
jgi:hypothetical protein